MLKTGNLLEKKEKNSRCRNTAHSLASQMATLQSFIEHRKSSCRCFVVDVTFCLLLLCLVQSVVYTISVVAFAFAARAAPGGGGVAVVFLIAGLHLRSPTRRNVARPRASSNKHTPWQPRRHRRRQQHGEHSAGQHYRVASAPRSERQHFIFLLLFLSAIIIFSFYYVSAHCSGVLPSRTSDRYGAGTSCPASLS